MHDGGGGGETAAVAAGAAYDTMDKARLSLNPLPDQPHPPASANRIATDFFLTTERASQGNTSGSWNKISCIFLLVLNIQLNKIAPKDMFNRQKGYFQTSRCPCGS